MHPEVVLRFTADDEGEPFFIGATGDPDLARAVAERLVAEAEAATAEMGDVDVALAALLGAEAARLRAVLDSLHPGPLRILPGGGR